MSNKDCLKVKKGGKFRQGLYNPSNPDKYVGDVTKIRYMSSWELNFFKFLDNNPNVLRWSSEEIAIPYIKPTDSRVHRYFPDCWLEYKDKNGQLKQELIEIKPKSQIRRSRSRKPKTKLYDDVNYAINLAKWNAAQQFCDKYGMKFRILTEDQLFR